MWVPLKSDEASLTSIRGFTSLNGSWNSPPREIVDASTPMLAWAAIKFLV
jgi:hypothetical protein